MKLSVTLIEDKIVCLPGGGINASKFIFPYNEEKLKNLSVEVRDALKNAVLTSSSSTEQLKRAGEHLAVYFSSVVKIFADYQGFLRLDLDPQLAFIPWELIFDGEDFWARKFIIGRKLLLNISNEHSSRRSDKMLIVVSDPENNLPRSINEAERLIGFTDSTKFKTELLVNPSKKEFLNALTDYEIFHYIGHSKALETDKKYKNTWIFTDGVLYPDEILKTCSILSAPAFVFSNSCSGNTPSGKLHSDFPAAFFSSGSLGIISTLWDLPDLVASEFSTEFYKRFFNGKTIGESFKIARKVLQDKSEGFADLLYILYADPRTTLSFAKSLPRNKVPENFIKHEEKEIRKSLNKLPILKQTAFGLFWIFLMFAALLGYDKWKTSRPLNIVISKEDFRKQSIFSGGLAFSGIKGKLNEDEKTLFELKMIKHLASLRGIVLVDARNNSNKIRNASVEIWGRIIKDKNNIRIMLLAKNIKTGVIIYADELKNPEHYDDFCLKFAEWVQQKYLSEQR